MQNIHNSGSTGFLRTAQRFIFQCRDSTSFVSWWRIFVNRLAIRKKIALKVVNQMNNLIKNFLVFLPEPSRLAQHQTFPVLPSRRYCRLVPLENQKKLPATDWRWFQRSRQNRRILSRHSIHLKKFLLGDRHCKPVIILLITPHRLQFHLRLLGRLKILHGQDQKRLIFPWIQESYCFTAQTKH